MERQLVVAHADFNPGRRLHGSGGEVRSLYAELMHNLSSRTKPEGGALTTVVEKFITTTLAEARKAERKPEDVIHEKLEALSELVMGYDFASVIAAYWRAYEKDDDTLKANAIRWLRGEFSAKTDARAALGVREIINDAALYDQLKLLARFTRLAGYKGLLICLDELVNLYKLTNPQARNGNYEKSCASSTTSNKATSKASASSSAAPRNSSPIRAGASTATPHCNPASRKTPSPATA